MKQQKHQQEGITILHDEELEGIVGGAAEATERWNTWQHNSNNTVTLQQHFKHGGIVDDGPKRTLDLTKDRAYIPKGARDSAIGKSFRENL